MSQITYYLEPRIPYLAEVEGYIAQWDIDYAVWKAETKREDISKIPGFQRAQDITERRYFTSLKTNLATEVEYDGMFWRLANGSRPAREKIVQFRRDASSLIRIPKTLTPEFYHQVNYSLHERIEPAMKEIRRRFPIYGLGDRPVEDIPVTDLMARQNLRFPQHPSMMKFELVGETFHFFVSQRYFVNEHNILIRRGDNEPHHWVDLFDTEVLSSAALIRQIREREVAEGREPETHLIDSTPDRIMTDFYERFERYRQALQNNVEDQVRKAFLYKTEAFLSKTGNTLNNPIVSTENGVLVIGEVANNEPTPTVVLHGDSLTNIPKFLANLCPTCHKTKKP